MSAPDTFSSVATFDHSLFLPDDFVEERLTPLLPLEALVPPTVSSLPSAFGLADLERLHPVIQNYIAENTLLSEQRPLENEAPAASLVPDHLDWDDVKDQINALTRSMAQASGRRDVLIEREAARVREVGESKGRDTFKPDIESILEILQKEAHQRSVGMFEKMLTAISRDVQPSSPITIKLKLSTERNMPALEVLADVNGKPEKITSGALANVVSTGLRFITLARSGQRRFLVLDEADCWIETGDVQNFFNVVNQLSIDAGIQTLIITHHDLSAFEEDFRIYQINEVESQDAWPRRMPELVSAGRMNPSELQDDVISFVELDNFEAYTHANIELAPGVTAIVGKNRGAKSAWARALRAALMGESDESNIRHDQPAIKVAVGFSDGRVLEHNRRIKGTPKADYILHSPESWDFAKANPGNWTKHPGAPPTLHNSPMAKVPEWLPVETGVGEIDGINVQLWGQLSPVFMLNESASKRASLLSIGRESGHLFAMNALYKEDVLADNKIAREGEKEIFNLRANLAAFEGFEAVAEVVEGLGSKLQELSAESQWLDKGKDLLVAVERQRIDNAYYDQWGGLEKLLPTEPSLARTEDLMGLIDRLGEALAMQACKTTVTVPDLPEMAPTTAVSDLINILAVASADAALKGAMPVLPVIPGIEPTADLSDLLQSIEKARESASLKGAMPLIPKLPQVGETESLSKLLSSLQEANTDRQRPIIAMPMTPGIRATQSLQQWCEDTTKADTERKLPRIETPKLPEVQDTSTLTQWCQEAERAITFINACKAQAAVLNQKFDGVQTILENASKSLGFDAFQLPADVAKNLARDAVLSFESGSESESQEKVVAYFSRIQEQIQLAARKGFLQGMENTLDLPQSFFDHTPAQAAGDESARIAKRPPRP